MIRRFGIGNYMYLNEFQKRYLSLYGVDSLTYVYLAIRLDLHPQSVRYYLINCLNRNSSKKNRIGKNWLTVKAGLLNEKRALKNCIRKFPSFKEAALDRINDLNILINRKENE